MKANRKAIAGKPGRLHERYALYRDLTIVYEGYGQEISLRVPDLSHRGMFINTPQGFPEGAVLGVRFRLSGTGAEVSARGEVRYCLGGVGIGVEFVEISSEAEQAIEEELRQVRNLMMRTPRGATPSASAPIRAL
jgi:hypothetical protein